MSVMDSIEDEYIERLSAKDKQIAVLTAELACTKKQITRHREDAEDRSKAIAALRAELEVCNGKCSVVRDLTAERDRYREALERISRYDSYHQEWPNDIYINAPPEELALFTLEGNDYPPEIAQAAKEGRKP